MKKSLILASVAALMLSSTMSFADTTPTLNNNNKKPECTCKKGPKAPKQVKRQTLDEKLKLTDEQKKQAHEVRMKGHEKIKPVIEKMKAKHDEIKKVLDSNLSDEQKEKKINALERDLLTLKQQARKIRTDNMKDFEAILTPEQKAEFDKMKKEAREKHKMKKRHGKPGFGPAPYGPKKPMPQQK